MPEKTNPTIYQELARIQKELRAPKGQYNSFSKFNYRSCEDIVEAVKPLLGNLSLLLTDEIVLVGNRYYVKAIASITDGRDNYIAVDAFAREAEDKKGMDEAQITGAASSYARKYALNGLFAIDDTKDADTRDNTPKPTKKIPETAPKPVIGKAMSRELAIFYVGKMKECGTVAELEKVAGELKTFNIDDETKGVLLDAYGEQKKSLEASDTFDNEI